MTEDQPANDEMVEGYRDGLNLDNPEPSSNRSHSYRHGFRAGRSDRGNPWEATVAEVRAAAQLAMKLDEEACR